MLVKTIQSETFVKNVQPVRETSSSGGSRRVNQLLVSNRTQSAEQSWSVHREKILSNSGDVVPSSPLHLLDQLDADANRPRDSENDDGFEGEHNLLHVSSTVQLAQASGRALPDDRLSLLQQRFHVPGKAPASNSTDRTKYQHAEKGVETRCSSKHRIESVGNTESFDASQDWLSVTQQDQNISASWTGTPSKLLGKLHLSDSGDTSKLSDNCRALSRLVLSSKDRQSAWNREGQKLTQLKQGGRADPAGILTKEPVVDTCRAKEPGDAPCDRSLVTSPSKKVCLTRSRLQQADSARKSHNSLNINRWLEDCEGAQKEAPVTSSAVSTSRPCLSASGDAANLFNIASSVKPLSLREKQKDSGTLKGQVARGKAADAKRLSLPEKQAACVLSKPLRLPGSKMIHISSPSSRQKASCDIYSVVSESSVLPTKRSFEMDSSGLQKGDLADFRSPLKRRKMDAIHGTSTPRKSFLPAAEFKMNETLSTICGSDSDAEGTVVTVSTNDKTLEDEISLSESEDEVCTLVE
jgi:hypothetical protein